MNFLKSVWDAFGFTTGIELVDKVRAGDMPSLACPQPESEEISEQMLSEIIAQTRYQERNHGLIGQITLDISLYSVGCGIKAQPMTEDDAWNAKARTLWEMWCEMPEITGKFDMYEVQDLMCRALDTDGEFYIILLSRDGRPCIQIIEAPQVTAGFDEDHRTVKAIQTDAYGKPVSYGIKSGKSIVRIDARHVIHIANWHRATSVRGLPTLQRSIGPVADLKKMTELEKRKCNAISGISLFVAKEDHRADDEGGGGNPFAPVVRNDDADTTNQDMQIVKNFGGIVMRGRPGESVTAINSDNPGMSIQAFRSTLKEEVCLSELPYSFIADPAALGGASARLVLNKAGRYFEVRQQKIIKAMTKLYRWYIAYAITKGMLPSAPDWERVEWQVPKKASVDAGRDSANDREDAKAGLKPLEDIYAEQDLNYNDEMRKRYENLKLAKEYADKLNIDPAVFLGCFTATAGLSAPNTTDPNNNPPAAEQGAEPQTTQP